MDGSLKVLDRVDVYAYDSEEFIRLNWTTKLWEASVDQARGTETHWNTDSHLLFFLHQCEIWLWFYLEHCTSEFMYPALHLFVPVSQKNNLTCMATGFDRKDLVMEIRKDCAPVNNDLLTSSRVRPNGDGTYQLRKTVMVLQDEIDDYSCSINHKKWKEPKTVKMKKTRPPYEDMRPLEKAAVGAISGSVVFCGLIVALFFIYCLYKKYKTKTNIVTSPQGTPNQEAQGTPTQGASPQGMAHQLCSSPLLPPPTANNPQELCEQTGTNHLMLNSRGEPWRSRTRLEEGSTADYLTNSGLYFEPRCNSRLWESSVPDSLVENHYDLDSGQETGNTTPAFRHFEDYMERDYSDIDSGKGTGNATPAHRNSGVSLECNRAFFQVDQGGVSTP